MAHVCEEYNSSNRAVLRIILLKITRRPLVSPPIPERDFDPSNLPPIEPEGSSSTLSSSSPRRTHLSTPEHLKNNHISLDAPNPILSQTVANRSNSPVENYLLPKALSPSSVKPPICLVRPLATPKEWVSEIVYILRPLIYGNALTNVHFYIYSCVCCSHCLVTPNEQRTPTGSFSCSRLVLSVHAPYATAFILLGTRRVCSSGPRPTLVLLSWSYLELLHQVCVLFLLSAREI